MVRLILLVGLIVSIALGQCALACTLAITENGMCCSSSHESDPCCPDQPQAPCECQDTDSAAVVPVVAEITPSDTVIYLITTCAERSRESNALQRFLGAARAPPGLEELRTIILLV